MTLRSGVLIGAQHRTQRLSRDIGLVVLEARKGAGVTQKVLSAAVGISRSYLSRIEHGHVRNLNLALATRLCAVLGLDLVVKAYPSGAPIRDAGQVQLLQRFDREVSPAYRRRNEAGTSIPGDPRAWDRRLDGPVSIGVEGETRLADVQALERKLSLKQRDSGVERLILVVRDSRHNREVLRLTMPTLRQTFPLGTREVLAALRAGRDPGANGIVVL